VKTAAQPEMQDADRVPDAGTAVPVGAVTGREAGGRSRLRSLAWLWINGTRFAHGERDGRTRPRPEGAVKIVGPSPIRILLVGGDYAIGVGVATRAAALDGALARVVHEATGRGVIVENRSREQLRLRDLAASLGSIGAYSFDLVVCAPTFAEAARCPTLRPWRESADALLRVVRTTSDASVVLLGIPALLGAQPLALIARRRAAQINRVLQAVADRDDRAHAVEPPSIALHELATVSAADAYRDTAAAALQPLLRALAGSAGTPAAAASAQRSRALPHERLAWLR
jgi:hypothetical protein